MEVVGAVSVPLRGKGRDQQAGLLCKPVWLHRFPSPCGEKVGINRNSGSVGPSKLRMFPSPCGEKVGINFTQEQIDEMLRTLKFPSPCGEKVGINLKRLLKGFGCFGSFPSPCGEKVGINAVMGSTI